MESIGKIVLLAAAALAVVGGVLLVAGKLGLERLPGDIVIRRDGLTIYIPVGLMVLLSVLGSLALHILRRL
jgi:hypothetical protein